jgi:hypothetical protein
VAHVGIERLRPGQRKEHAAHDRESDERIGEHETRRLPRTERFENFGRCPDIDGAEQSDGDEPGDHDRAKQPADARGSPVLYHEQPDQDYEGQRQNEFFQVRRDELESLHRREHGNGRRDDAVAIEQRRSHDAEQDQNRKLGRVRNPFGSHQGQQRQNSAFAVVVGA